MARRPFPRRGGAGAAGALTFDGFSAQPRWSPDGTQLAFVRRPESGKPPQLQVLPLAGGEARALTKLEKGAGLARVVARWQAARVRVRARPGKDTPRRQNRPSTSPRAS